MPAPKGLFPPEPEHYRGPKLKVAIIGAGLAGMSTAVELLDQGHEVWLILFSCPQCWRSDFYTIFQNLDHTTITPFLIAK
jgi:thioredoxin reductase